jgi:hypothetical protein
MSASDIPIREVVKRLKGRLDLVPLPSRRLDFVNEFTVLGRLSPDLGEVEDLELIALLNALGEVAAFRALTDIDDEILQDLDGESLFDVIGAIDNPIRQTAIFDTVADMLASPAGTWDKALTMNWAGTDSNAQQWQLIQDPGLAANGTDLLALDDGLGFARTFTARGQSSAQQFITAGDVPGLIGASRYTHVQSTPAASWNIVHPLNGKPTIVTTDEAGNRFFGDEQYVSDSIIAVSFARTKTGLAHLL